MSLEQLRSHIDRLLDHTDDGLYGVDREGRATLVTPSVMAMTGHSMDDVMGRAIHDVLHHSHKDGAHYPRQECPIFRACRNGQVGHARDTFWRKDGTSFPIEFATTPIVEQGEIVGGIVVLRDLERRGDLERELASTMRAWDAAASKPTLGSESRVAPPMGRSAAWMAAMDMVRRVAPVDTTVLLCGESGTGKELVARTLHDLSPRRGRPLVKLNCAAIPAGLVESELFGHERGAFTGASTQRIGRFEQAEDGTLFLDEVGELPLDAQAKLLRVLQEREFERVGGGRTIVSRARIVAATNRNLAASVERGTFRADLFYRLQVFPIHLPPLRERREDIPLLARHFFERIQHKLGRRLFGLSTESERRLLAYHWPGNVRELENAIERAAIMSDEGAPLTLPLLNGFSMSQSPPSQIGSAVDQAAILAALEEHQWKITGPRGAAAALGLHPNTLRYRMQQLRVRRPGPSA